MRDLHTVSYDFFQVSEVYFHQGPNPGGKYESRWSMLEDIYLLLKLMQDNGDIYRGETLEGPYTLYKNTSIPQLLRTICQGEELPEYMVNMVDRMIDTIQESRAVRDSVWNQLN